MAILLCISKVYRLEYCALKLSGEFPADSWDCEAKYTFALNTTVVLLIVYRHPNSVVRVCWEPSMQPTIRSWRYERKVIQEKLNELPKPFHKLICMQAGPV